MLRANVPTCLRAKFSYVPTCHDMLRANVPTCLRAMRCYVPTCLRAKFSYVPTCHNMLRANVPTCLRAKFPYVPTCHDMLRANVPNFFACQRAIACYVPTCLWPNFLTCQCAIACYVQTCIRSCPSCANLPAYQIVVCGPFVGSFLNFWAIQLQTVSFEAYFSSFAKSTTVKFVARRGSKLLGKIIKHDNDIIHIENTVETFTITVLCQNIFNWPRKEFPNTKVSYLFIKGRAKFLISCFF